MKINVGFVLNNNKDSWRGGYEYTKNLFKAIQNDKKSKINPIILCSTDKNKKYFSDLGQNIKIIKSPIFNNSFIKKISHKIKILFFGRNYDLDNFLIENNIKVISHFFVTGKRSKIKNIFWIPDFQELKKLDYLSLKMKILRYINTYFSIYHSNLILLSSFTAQKDLKNLSKVGFNKSAVLRPTFTVQKKTKSLNFLIKKYNIMSKYFFLPNQFWVHKNHIQILRAINTIKIKYKKNIQIVSTGILHDYRYPDHRKMILKFIKEKNLSKNFVLLGIVPFDDLMSLMKHSMAVINPSKSEGWSSTVEQAKSFGKLILLSNIDVHKEQKPKRSFYFNPNINNSLIKELIDTEKNFKKVKEEKIIHKTLMKQKKSFIKLSENYSKIINSLIN